MAIAEAKGKIEARATQRQARAQADYEAELAAKAAVSGKKPRGKPLQPPTLGPRAEDQINLTDEVSRTMPVLGGGLDQCYNAQAAVDSETLLVLAPQVTQAVNDYYFVVAKVLAG